MKGMMTGEKDYLFICIPLAAGVLAATLLSEYLTRGFDAAAVCAAISFTAAAFCLWAIISDRNLRTSALLWSVTFFLCGALCLFQHRILFFDFKYALGSFLDAAGTRIKALIDTIPFTDGQNTALTKALVTGDRSGLEESTKAAFRKGGAAHILALSGMHLGIIYLIVNRALLILGNTPPARLSRSLLTIVLTGLYTLMCGAGSSLLRAWLFIALYEGGKMTGRPQNAPRVFCTALTIHLVLRPGDMADIGFQLSYLAMAGIVFIWPSLRTLYRDGDRKGTGRKIWDLASLSISCQLFTGPVSYFYFHTFPKFFLLTNLVCAPLLPAVMACCLAALALTACGADGPIFGLLEMPLEWLRAFLDEISALSS